MTSSTPDWSEIRSHFPAVEHQVYLNTAGGGPMSREAFEAVRAYHDAFYRDGDTGWEHWLGRVEAVREQLATMLGVSSEEIAFLSNASHGLNLVADLLSGDGGVVALRAEFPSVTMPWLSRGRTVRFLDAPDELHSALGPGTDVLAVSLVQYQTGHRFDLAELSALCRERDVRLVVDATQAFGVSAIDLEAAPVDALVFSGYKWANAGYGIAPLYVRGALLKELGLPATGWRSAAEPYALNATHLDLTSEARGLELGHPPFAGVAALGGALGLVQRIGIATIEDRVAALTASLHRGLDAKGLCVTSPPDSPITMLEVDEPEALTAALAEKKILVSARGSGVRISLHYYNSEDDIGALLDAL